MVKNVEIRLSVFMGLLFKVLTGQKNVMLEHREFVDKDVEVVKG